MSADTTRRHVEHRNTDRRDSGRRTGAPRKRRKSARARRRQRLLILMGMVVVLLILTIAAAVLAYKRWEMRYDSDVSVMFIEENGKIVTNDVVPFDSGKYNSRELEDFIRKTITDYNKANEQHSIVQEGFSLENNIASLILEFADAKTYTDFTGTEVFLGSISEAVAAGYEFDGQFASLVDGKAIETSFDKFSGQTDLKVAIVKANTRIQVDGQILYLSAENVESYGEDWVVSKEHANLLDSGHQNEPLDTEETEADTNENETEVLPDAPAVTEEPSEEDTGIIFDFGDEESDEDETDETYSDVYVYIIYK